MEGKLPVLLRPDIDGTGSCFLLDSILSILLKKGSSDVWVVLYQLHHRCFFFMLASGHPGLEIKIRFDCPLYSTL